MPDPWDIPDEPTYLPPTGLDWADGTKTDDGTLDGDTIGTPNPTDQPISPAKPDGEAFFEESPDSPEIERGEQCTVRHTFKCDEGTFLSLIPSLSRGRLDQATDGTIWRLLSATGKRHLGGYYILTTVSESISFDNPPDQFRIEAVELNPDIMKHPRYGFLLPMERQWCAAAAQAPATIKSFKDLNDRLLGIPHTPMSYVLASGKAINITTGPTSTGSGDPVYGPSPAYWNTTSPNGSGTNQDHFAAAMELAQKLFIGESTFYMPGFKVQWTQFYWLPQPLDPGGRIEDPIGSGNLPFFFWSTSNPQSPDPDNGNIFDQMADLNPQLYADGISWMRLADMPFSWERTWFSVTRTWIGAPWSHWDGDLYNPLGAADFPLPPFYPLGQPF